MPAHETRATDRYPWPLRLLHWLLAGLVTAQLTLILCFGELQSLQFGQFALAWHRSIGALILAVVATRLVIGVFVRGPTPLPRVARWQRLAAKATHWGILLLLGLQSTAGLALAGARGDAVSAFGLFDLPPVVPYDPRLADQLLSAHRVIGSAVLGLLALHVGAVGFHRLVGKRNILPRMLAAADLGGLADRLPIWSQIVTVCLTLLCLTFSVGFFAVAKTKAAGLQSAAAFAEIINVGGKIHAGQADFDEARLALARDPDGPAVTAPLGRAADAFAGAERATRDPDVREQAGAAARQVRELARRAGASLTDARLAAALDQVRLLGESEDAAIVRAKVEAEQASASAHDLVYLSILPAALVVLALAAMLCSSILGWLKRTRLQAAATAEQAKTEFLSNLNHEIRTPLNGVLGLVDALGGTALTPSQRELAQTIAASAGALSSLLIDVLDFGQLEAGALQIVEKPFRLDELVCECAALFEPAIREKGLALKVELAEASRRRVVGDPARLRQILTNLLSNALKFTRTGEVGIVVSEAAAGSYRIQVRDTGVGFDPAKAEALFARFEQADGSMTREFGGAGLGLALCRQLAERMGGAITATGAPGKGATFTLVLPLRADGDAGAAEPASAEVESAEPASLRVLVTDDNAANRRVAELILQAVGAEVACAENGLEAVQATAREPFDLVLMDLQMPVMDGLAAILAIRKREASQGAGRVPIIVVSANALPEQIAASRAAGADDHLGKPLRAEALIGAIERVMGAEAAADLAAGESGG